MFAREDIPVLGVHELTRAIRGLLADAFPAVWAEGEVSRITRSARGHVYFTLRDRHQATGEEASLSAVLFASSARRWAGELREGARVQCRGRLDVYPPRGGYQLIVDQVRPVGRGDLLAALEETKRRLQAEGLFAAERKRPLPFLPRVIGVATSPTGAALRDILNVLRRRFPVRVVVAPCVVQGAQAPASIVGALRQLDERSELDAIIVGRGGGSLEDLWCFNDERVARAVAAARVPVVSAVGHEIDSVLTDLVADLRAPTPSAAAELVVPERAALQGRVEELRGRLAPALRRELQTRSQRIDEQLRRSRAAVGVALARGRRRVAESREALRRCHPGARLALQRRTLESLRRRLVDAGRRGVDERRRRLIRLEAGLKVLGPQAQLARGYAVVRTQDERVVRDARDVAPGERLGVLLHSGSLDVVVEETSWDGVER